MSAIQTQSETLAPISEPRLNWGPYLWFCPAILILFLVTLYPSIFVAWLSFQKTKYYELVGFIGLTNYAEVFAASAFWDTTF